MTPPSKWLFFPSPAASAGIKLEVDFTLVDGGDGKIDGSSPTWSGTDAGSPDNYALNSYTLRYRNGKVFLRVAFGGSGDYTNRGSWIGANGTTLDQSTTVLTREDGTTLTYSGATIGGTSSSTNSFLQINFSTGGGGATWMSGLTVGDTCNIKLDW